MAVVDLQIQAKALGDPTRHGIFRYIADAAEPADVAELTEHLGLNHNAIRQHLAQLVAAELVVESVAPAGGRGRPRRSMCSIRMPIVGGVWPGPTSVLPGGLPRSCGLVTVRSRSGGGSGGGVG